MRIQRVQVVNFEITALYNAQFSDAGDPNLLSLLHDTLRSLDKKTIQKRLYRIAFEKDYLDLLWFKEAIFIISSHWGDTTPMEKMVFSHYLQDIEDNLGSFDHLSEAFEYVRLEAEMFNEGNYANYATGAPVNELNIAFSYVCESWATPISHVQVGDEMDPLMSGPMFSALSAFSRHVLGKSIQMIQLGNNKMFLRWTESRLYILITHDETHRQEYDKRTSDQVDNLLGMMSNSIDLLIDTNDGINTSAVNTIMQSYITEGTQAISEKKVVEHYQQPQIRNTKKLKVGKIEKKAKKTKDEDRLSFLKDLSDKLYRDMN